jgi:formylmethanofuran dehydrogenase subunit E-like metal-binding protein
MTLVFAVVISGSASAASSNNTSYTIGQNVTQQALNDKNLGFENSEKNLVITTAGSAKLNNSTTEKSLSAIVDKTKSLSNDQKITYGNGNLVEINDPSGALTYAFVSKAANGELKAKEFTVIPHGTSYKITSSATVLISGDLTQNQWNYDKQQLGDDLYSIVSIANAWSNNAPIDLLALAQSNGRIAPGTISGYAATKAFIKQYPAQYSAMSAKDEYIIIAVPGGYDDDAITYLATWNYKYLSAAGNNNLESAYILWNSSSETGNLALFKFNNNLPSEFKAATGVTVVNGTYSEILFNNWLLNLLKTNPGKLITVEKTADINQTDLNYLYGTSNGTNITTEGAGLSEKGIKYILGLHEGTSPFNVTVNSVTSNDTKYSDFVTLGAKFAEYAKSILTGLPGAYGDIAVATAPVYATSHGYYIRGFYDGLTSVIGTDPNNLIQVSNPYLSDSYLNHDLYLTFYINGKNSTGNATLYAIQAEYNPVTGNYTWSNPVNLLTEVTDFSVSYIQGYGNSTGKDQQGNGYFNSGMDSMPLAVMGYLWSNGISYDVKKVWNKVGICMCGAAYTSVIESVIDKYPLSAGESYTVIGPIDTDSSSYDARLAGALNEGLGVSVGTNTYITANSNLDSNSDIPNLIVIVKNSATGKATVHVINFNGDAVDWMPNDVASYLSNPASASEYLNSIIASTSDYTINLADVNKLLSSEDSINFLKNYESSSDNGTTNPTTSTNSTNSTDNSGNSQSNESGNQLKLSAAIPTSTSQSVGQDSGQANQGQQANSGQNGKTSEITPVGSPSSSGGSGSPLLIVIGISLIAILVGLGFFKGNLLGLIKK